MPPLSGLYGKGYQWNLQSVLPRRFRQFCGAGRGKACFSLGRAACFSAGRGDHPRVAGGFEDGRCKEQQAIVQVTTHAGDQVCAGGGEDGGSRCKKELAATVSAGDLHYIPLTGLLMAPITEIGPNWHQLKLDRAKVLLSTAAQVGKQHRPDYLKIDSK